MWYEEHSNSALKEKFDVHVASKAEKLRMILLDGVRSVIFVSHKSFAT